MIRDILTLLLNNLQKEDWFRLLGQDTSTSGSYGPTYLMVWAISSVDRGVKEHLEIPNKYIVVQIHRIQNEAHNCSPFGKQLLVAN